MRVHVDTARCETHAQCVFAAPDVFTLDDDDELTYDPAPADTSLQRNPPWASRTTSQPPRAAAA